MATAVSIAIRRDAAQVRIQAAAMTLAAQHGMGNVDLAPRHKQPDIRAVMTLEAVADFLEALATAESKPTPLPPKRLPEPPKPIPPRSAPRKV